MPASQDAQLDREAPETKMSQDKKDIMAREQWSHRRKTFEGGSKPFKSTLFS